MPFQAANVMKTYASLKLYAAPLLTIIAAAVISIVACVFSTLMMVRRRIFKRLGGWQVTQWGRTWRRPTTT